jgi:hypothetical protein
MNMKQNPLRLLFLVLSLLCGSLQAAETEPVDNQAVVNRANQLLEMLDHLLLDDNHSSIKKILNEGDASTRELVDEAMRLKTEGERLLSENEPMQAAVSLQSSLDHVFMAIRQEEGQAAEPASHSAELAEQFKSNDTFLEAAERVVASGQNTGAAELLSKAKLARASADSASAQGNEEEAMQALANSTQLAQQAIMKVRDGQEIERRQ